MAILRKKEIRQMDRKEIDKRLQEISLELAKEKANVQIGSSVKSPGKIREMRKTIARIKTMRKDVV
ncbi:MAG: 50S ribosomal protein L29 [Candidatus Aenigmarchaeota archaeon]|nr:50S ribosomal protein L29 [Candidatus Aenigmarchaeota archaeon]